MKTVIVANPPTAPVTRWKLIDADSERIELRGFMTPGRTKIASIPRSSIISVTQSIGKYRLETTGGNIFEVVPGMTRKQREKNAAAFAIHHTPAAPVEDWSQAL